MNKIDYILENYSDENILSADGFDDAIIGYAEKSGRVIYSVTKCIEILCLEMSEEDAWDHFGFNVEGSYVGEKTPIWCHDDVVLYNI